MTSFLTPTPVPLAPRLCGLTRLCSRHRIAASIDHALEPSFPIPTPTSLPPALLSTTIYHNIPSIPEHHSSPDIPPLSHPADGDAYVLALSFPPDPSHPTWLRARFVRTRPFMLESRRRKRVFRGLYGTPGIVGLNAPVKPKASAAKGIFLWPSSSFLRPLVYGLRALPLMLSRDVLVTRGPTALGAILSDSGDLLNLRPTELSHPPIITTDAIFTIGVSRAPVGRVLAAFISQLDLQGKLINRFPKIPVPPFCDVVSATLNDEFVVLAMHRAVEESGGPFAAVLGTGRAKQPPALDLDFGTHIVLLSRASGQVYSTTISGTLLTHLTAIFNPSSTSLQLHAVQLSTPDPNALLRISTVADTKSGQLWAHPSSTSNYLSVPVRLDLSLSESDSTIALADVTPMQFSETLLVADVATSPSLPFSAIAYVVHDTKEQRSGLALVTNPNEGVDQVWLASHEDDRVSGACISPSGDFVTVLVRQSSSARIDIFDLHNISSGPLTSIPLSREQFGFLHASVGTAWSRDAAEWNNDGNKSVKSSYEIFDSRDWNDINSNFSSLGF